MDHNIPLDELLADAAEALRNTGLNALASAVETARARLDRQPEKNDTTTIRLMN